METIFDGLKVKNGMVGEGIRFERIRRITGYLVGDVRGRFNDAKRAEERDRVKHMKMERLQSALQSL